MRVEKFRGAADDNGLVPAGQYFAMLARGLEQANVRQSARQAQLDEEDRRLEARYRRASASRNNTFEDTRAIA